MVDPASRARRARRVRVRQRRRGEGEARALIREIGWPKQRIVDLGDITAARGTEMYLLLWLG